MKSKNKEQVIKELYKEYLELCKGYEETVEVEIKCVVFPRFHIHWSEGDEATIDTYDDNDLGQEFYDKLEKIKEIKAERYCRKIRRMIEKSNIAAKRFGMDEQEFWQMVIDEDYN